MRDIETLESRKLLAPIIFQDGLTLSITGTPDNDVIDLFVTADQVTVTSPGGNASFMLTSAVDAVLISGLGGDDTITLAGNVTAGGGRVVNLAAGDGQDVVSATDTVFDSLSLGPDSDMLRLTRSTGNLLDCGDGDDDVADTGDPAANASRFDTIIGGGGDDTLRLAGLVSAGAGNDDVILYTPGSHTLGDGNDTVVEFVSARVTIDGGDGNDTFTSNGPQTNTFFGGNGDDTLDNTLAGRGGFLYGGHGNDTLIGSAFNDTLQGEGGADSILAGGGDDTIYPGPGADIIDAGDGRDIIRYTGSNTSHTFVLRSDGTADDGSSVTTFTGAEVLLGSNAADNFQVQTNGAIRGWTINGGSGQDHLSFTKAPGGGTSNWELRENSLIIFGNSTSFTSIESLDVSTPDPLVIRQQSLPVSILEVGNALTVGLDGPVNATLHASATLTTLQIGESSRLTLAGSVLANALPVIAATGTLDLADQTLTIDTGSTPISPSALRATIASAYAGGAWSGPGITSNLAGSNIGVGYKVTSDLSGSTPRFSATLKATFFGDADLNGAVDVTDLGRLANGFRSTSAAAWESGDFNYDGLVDVTDLGLLAANFRAGTMSIATSSPSRITSTLQDERSGHVLKSSPA